MIDCQRGCLLRNQHTPDCTCTHDCPDHDNHCEGCLPREAEVGGYCQKCAFKLRDTIDQIATLIGDLRLIRDGRLAPPDRAPGDDPTRAATRVDQHSPSPAHDTADEASRWIHAWAIAVADERAERGPFEYRNDGIPEPNPTTEARYLTARIAHITDQPYANDLTDEARQLAHSLTRASGQAPADQRIPAICPACDRRTLYRPNGEDNIRCRRCEAHWSPETFGMLSRAAAS